MAPSLSRRMPRRSLGVGLALVLVGASVGLTSAAPNRPTVSVTPTVTGSSASVVVGVNRGPNAIASCTYALDAGAATSCGTASDAGKKAAAYTISLAGLSIGEHTITVNVTLTDGGGATGSASFTIQAPPRAFIRAWTNVDGIGGYDPTGDVLIAELVDTNRNDVLDAGDSVITNQYPLGFDYATAGFGTFDVTTHIVATVTSVFLNEVRVADAAGNRYRFFRSFLELYQEVSTPGEAGASIGDIFNDDIDDRIVVEAGAPSDPSTLADLRTFSPTNDSFIDIAWNMP